MSDGRSGGVIALSLWFGFCRVLGIVSRAVGLVVLDEPTIGTP